MNVKTDTDVHIVNMGRSEGYYTFCEKRTADVKYKSRIIKQAERRATCKRCRREAGIDAKADEGRFVITEGKAYDEMMWWCVGCDRPHVARLRDRKKPEGSYSYFRGVDDRYLQPHRWDGNKEFPTINPCWYEMRDGEDACHLYIKGGRIEFCQGTHGLRGDYGYPPPLEEMRKKSIESERAWNKRRKAAEEKKAAEEARKEKQRIAAAEYRLRRRERNAQHWIQQNDPAEIERRKAIQEAKEIAVREAIAEQWEKHNR